MAILLCWKELYVRKVRNNSTDDVHSVILSPRDSAIPCVLLRILTWPCIKPVPSTFSILKFANASSPKTLRAYKLADKKSHSPERAASGVRHAIFVDFMICARYWRRSLRVIKLESQRYTERLTGYPLSHSHDSPIRTRSTCCGTTLVSMGHAL